MEHKIHVDEEATKKLQDYWNNMSEMYEQKIETVTLQSSVCLAVQTQLNNAKTVLEVACGPGLESLFISKTLLQQGATLVCTDFSQEMITKLDKKISNPQNSYCNIEGNKFHVTFDELPQDFDLEKERQKFVTKETDRFVFGCLSNNEQLKFKDQTFDCYIANLSLMLVNNHKNQLSEAARVLKKGSYAGFSVWGRKENSSFFTISGKVLKKYDLAPPETGKTQFTLGSNLENLKKDFEEAGFSNNKMWYQPCYFPLKNGDEYFEIIERMPTFHAILSKLDNEKLQQVRKDMIDEYNADVSNVVDPKLWELVVIIAQKQ